MLPLYFIALAISSGLAGLFARHVAAGFGFVAGFQTGVYVAAGAAAAFAALQFLYMAGLRLLQPSRSAGPYLTEILSQAATLAFAPVLLGVEIPWPAEEMARFEPLILLGAFGALHVVFKLATFFASLQGETAPRYGSLPWLGAAAALGWVSFSCLAQWLAGIESARQPAPETGADYRVGGEFARAREMPEGATLDWEMAPFPEQTVTLRWANAPEAETKRSTVYVSATLSGAETKSFATSVRLKEDGWAEVRIPAEYVPRDANRVRVRWTRAKEPTWQRLLGLHPVVYGELPSGDGPPPAPATVLMSGPYQHALRADSTPLNVVIVSIDGLAAAQTGFIGGAKETTPSLDRLAQASLSFINAYTPAPEAAAANMTLMTGLGPLRHGYLGERMGPLAAERSTLAEVLQSAHYTTAAFTEGELAGREDLVFGSGFERGFELFDPSYARGTDGADAPPSQSTLDGAREWIGRHADIRFFLFVRLRELADEAFRERAGAGPDPQVPATPYAHHARALTNLDGRVGSLVKYIRDMDTRKNTCIVVTSSHGLDFSGGPMNAGLDESALHVPLIVFVPGQDGAARGDIVGLEDVAAVIARLAGTGPLERADGRDFLNGSLGKPAISVQGNPLLVSMRSDLWRFTWQSGTVPFEGGSVQAAEAIGLSRVSDRDDWPTTNSMLRHPEVVSRLERELGAYIARAAAEWGSPGR